MYIYSPKGVIEKGPKQLPKSWKKEDGSLIMNFHLLSDERLAEYHWFPVVGYGYNRTTQERGEPVFQTNKWVYPITEKTLEQVKEEQKNKFKPVAAKEIEPLDWRVIRYYGQEKLKLAGKRQDTKDSESDFIKLLEEIDSIRKKSDEKEAEIIAAKTVAEVLAVKWYDEEII